MPLMIWFEKAVSGVDKKFVFDEFVMPACGGLIREE